MKPITPISNAKFVYTDSAHTNIRERFDRIRNEQQQKRIVDFVLAVAVSALDKK